MLPEGRVSGDRREMSGPRGSRSASPRDRGTPHANTPRMHSVLFSLKRTFHKSVWFGRFLLKDYLLTPSRFDILYILKKQRVLRHVWQSKIREILGIAGPTLSRMIKALLALGFIRRKRSIWDRRQFEISLTKRGRETITHAMRTIIQSGIITSCIVHFICEKWQCPATTLRQVDDVDMKLFFMRERLLDRATLYYPWHPDD